jgi:hypothetical protein
MFLDELSIATEPENQTDQLSVSMLRINMTQACLEATIEGGINQWQRTSPFICKNKVQL